MAILNQPLRVAAVWITAAMCLCAAVAPGQTPPAAVGASKKPGEAVTLGKVALKGEVKPGAEITAVVQFTIEKGYHVQANPPSEPAYIPATLRMEPLSGVVSSPTKYPAGKEFPIPGLPTPLKVYEESFEILVPLKLAADAKLPLTLQGLLTYQACRGATCFPPRKVKVEVVLPK